MDRETVEELAQLLRLRLGPGELERAQAEIARLLGHFDMLQAVDTEGVEARAYPLPLELRLRPDRPEACLSQSEVLQNAPQARAGSFLVPRVVEG